MSFPGALRCAYQGLRGAAIVALGAGLLVGCTAQPAPKDPPSTTSPADSAEPSTTSSVAPEEPTPVPWERFSDPRTPGSFEVPPGWEVREVGTASPEQDLVSFGLFDEFGTRQLSYIRAVSGLGGACGPVAELDVREVDTEPFSGEGYVHQSTGPFAGDTVAQFSYRVVPEEFGTGAWGTLALSDSGPNGSCFYYNLLNDERGRIMFSDRLQVDRTGGGESGRYFASLDEAHAFVDTELYANLKRALLSFELHW